jgi:hypothetical protein
MVFRAGFCIVYVDSPAAPPEPALPFGLPGEAEPVLHISVACVVPTEEIGKPHAVEQI